MRSGGDEGSAEAVAAPVHDFAVAGEACEFARLEGPKVPWLLLASRSSWPFFEVRSS